MSRLIWDITDLHCDENFESELRIEKAVVLIKVDSHPEKYMTASRMNLGSDLRVVFMSSAISGSFILGVISLW